MDLFNEMPTQRKPIQPLAIEDFVEGEDGIARLPDWRLAEVLDFSYGPEIRRLTERHRDTLERFGPLCYRDIKSTGGRPGREYLYNFNQAIFLVIKSEAPNAIPVQIHVVEIYGLWATGKLRPIDEATALVVAQSSTQAYQQSPELVGLVQTLLASIAELHSGSTSIAERVASVQRTAIAIEGKLGDIVKRRPAPVRNQDVYDRIVIDFYMGRCPCCSRPDEVIIRDDKRTKKYMLDHVTDNPYKNGLHEMWPVCEHCNSKFKHDRRYRSEMMERFRVFQSRIAETFGQPLV